MKRTLLLLVLLAFAISGDAQNWNPFTPGVKRYFTNDYGYLKGMRIDSVAAYGNDLHYYPFKTARADRGGMSFFDWPWYNWVGKEVIKKPNGVFVFPNHWNDTIVIKPLSNIGDSWIFHQDGSGKYYSAEVTSIDTLTVLGLVDSVKTILLTAYENGIPITSDSFNNVEVVLSKSHGFYAVMSLYFFPYHAPDTNSLVEDYFLLNSLQPIFTFCYPDPIPGPYGAMFKLVDYRHPSPTEIYDWNVGDIHEYSSCEDFSTINEMSCNEPKSYRLDTIVDKSVTDTGVLYKRRGWRATLDTVIAGQQVYTIWPSSDSVFVPNTGSAFYMADMPEESPYFEGYLYYYFPDETANCNGGGTYCSWNYFLGMTYYQTYTIYRDRIGLIQHFSTGDFVNREDDLLYFVKSSLSCGNYLFPDTVHPVVASVKNINEIAPISIYPNPTRDELSIKTSLSNYKLAIINAMGQVVYNKNVCNNEQIINVGSLANGVYHLKLETAEHEVINRKIVIQH